LSSSVRKEPGPSEGVARIASIQNRRAHLGPVTILRTPTEIFANIDIPVVSVSCGYTGMSPEDMANGIRLFIRPGHNHHCQRYRAYGSQSTYGRGHIYVSGRSRSVPQSWFSRLRSVRRHIRMGCWTRFESSRKGWWAEC